MCESNAYIYNKENEEELFLEQVDIVYPEGDKIFLKNLFGEQKIFDGKIKEISLAKHKILLERI